MKTTENLKQQEATPAMFRDGSFFCPMCNDYFKESEYLRTVISNPRTLWLANMVTHYRHNHITSWNKCWDNFEGRNYRRGWFGDYEEEKATVNERAKRQIVRKCFSYIKYNNITIEDFNELDYNEEETIEFLNKKLA